MCLTIQIIDTLCGTYSLPKKEKWQSCQSIPSAESKICKQQFYNALTQSVLVNDLYNQGFAITSPGIINELYIRIKNIITNVKEYKHASNKKGFSKTFKFQYICICYG